MRKGGNANALCVCGYLSDRHMVHKACNVRRVMLKSFAPPLKSNKKQISNDYTSETTNRRTTHANLFWRSLAVFGIRTTPNTNGTQVFVSTHDNRLPLSLLSSTATAAAAATALLQPAIRPTEPAIRHPN